MSRAVRLSSLLLAVLCCLCSCADRARIIPEKKMVKIYTEMFIADEWLRSTPDARKMADTTLFFDPIFKKYGYDFEDFNRSLDYYTGEPEKFAKIAEEVSNALQKKAQEASEELEADTQRRKEAVGRYGYTVKEFRRDSMIWEGVHPFWDKLSPVEAPSAFADSLFGGDTLLEDLSSDALFVNDNVPEIKPLPKKDGTVAPPPPSPSEIKRRSNSRAKPKPAEIQLEAN